MAGQELAAGAGSSPAQEGGEELKPNRRETAGGAAEVSIGEQGPRAQCL